MGLVIGKPRGCSDPLTIRYRKDQSVADYIPLNPNPDTPHPIIPVTGAGDMFRAVYDQDANGVVDTVDAVTIQKVSGLQDIINDLYNQGGGEGGKEIVTVTNNGPDIFMPGQPVAKFGEMYIAGSSIAPGHRVIGLATGISAPGDTIRIQTAGLLTLPATSWDEVTGTVGGLGHGHYYYANNEKKLSIVPPAGEPEYLVKIGIALNTTDFLIDLDFAVKL